MCVRPSDIVSIRCGFTAAFDALSQAEQLALSERPNANFFGVEPTVEILEWLWERQVAAVAGDSTASESSPVGKRVDETGTVTSRPASMVVCGLGGAYW